MIFYKRKTVARKILNSFLNCFDVFETKRADFSLFFKRAVVVFLGFAALIYGLYLFYLPNYIDEKKAEDILSNYLAKNTKLTLDIENLKVSPNYKFDINLKADYIKLKYSKDNDFIVLEKPTIDINLLTLFFNYLDLNKIKTKKLTLNTTFLKTQKYSAFDYFDINIFKNKTKLELRNLKILADEFDFNLYDENINQKFSIDIDKFIFFDTALINSKTKVFKLNGTGKLSSNKFKMADLDLNIVFKTDSSSMYNLLKKLSELNYNPFRYAYEYKFYSKMGINLELNNVAQKQNIFGEVNLSDYTFKIKDINLPKNRAKLVFKDDKITLDCNFNFIKNQFIKIKANANFSKNRYLEAKLSSTKIELSDLKDVIDILTKIFNIKFAASDIDLTGTAGADLYLKSNFKTLVSKGTLKIKDAKLHHKKLGLTLNNINSDINFDNNKINVINTSALINNSKFYLLGTIDDKTNLNLKANSELINISQVLSLIQSLPVISKLLPELSDYNFKTGLIKINTVLKGNLKNPIIETNSDLKDFRVYIKSIKSEFYSPEISIKANPEKTTIKEINLKAKNSNFKTDKYIFKIPNADLKIKENDILLSKTPVNFEGINLAAEGLIKNYKLNSKEGNFDLSGTIPLNNNFISIKTSGSNIINFNSKAAVKNNNLAISNCTLSSGGKKILSLTGEIKNFSKPEINNLKILIPEKVSINSKALDDLSLEAKGDISLAGNIQNPNINSNLNIYNLSYKPLNLCLGDTIVNSKNSIFYINSTLSKIKDLSFDFVANAYYKNKKVFVDFAQVNSNYIDLSRFQNEFKKIKPDNIEFKNIKGNIQTLEFGGISLNSLNFEGKYKDDILEIDNLTATAYDGAIQGSGTINLKTNKVISDLIIKDIAIRKFLSELNEIKKMSIAVSGRLSALIKSEILIPNQSVFDTDDLIRNSNAYIKFNIDNGELAQFAKLERFLQAGNILSQSILKLSLNSIASVITKQNTGYFKTIEGTVKIYNSKADIQYIKTIGNNMSMYIEGKLNLLSQYAELNILGRIPVSIVSVMGNFGKFTTQKLVDKMSDDSAEVVKTITASPIEKMFSTYAPEETISKIPPLESQSVSTREFKVNIFGPISDTKSINDFKWIIKQ